MPRRIPVGISEEAEENVSKHRNFVFTWNNYDEQSIEQLHALDSEYLCYQPERGEQGTKHLQGLIVFKNRRSDRSVRRLVHGWHVEAMRGTVAQAKAYCSKDDTRDLDAGFGFTERGVEPLGRGTRSDLDDLAAALRRGASRRELFSEHFSCALKFGRGIDEALRIFEPRRDFKSVVYWYHGPTGSGKSRAASIEAPNAYWKGAGKWWSGYDGHEDVIIDDYRREFFPFDELLRLFDRYPMSVETKGGHAQFRPKRIFVTTCFDPTNTWVAETPENLGQLLRRIEYIKEFRNDGTPDLS